MDIRNAGGTVQLQNILRNQIAAEKARARSREQIVYHSAMIEESEIMKVKGIGKKSAERLLSRGIDTIEKLAELTEEQISEITGNPLTAKSLMNSIKSM